MQMNKYHGKKVIHKREPSFFYGYKMNQYVSLKKISLIKDKKGCILIT